jgi:YhcG PDDEXK nuclease domain
MSARRQARRQQAPIGLMAPGVLLSSPRFEDCERVAPGTCGWLAPAP